MNQIQNAWENWMASIPNVVAALILLLIAIICALVVNMLVEGAFNVFKIDKTLDKAGMGQEHKTSFKTFIAKLFSLITFILFVPGIFEKVGLSSVATPIVTMLDKFLSYLPDITAAVVILIIGLFIAKAIRELVIPCLNKVKIDEYLSKVGVESSSKTSYAEIIANVVYVLILIPIVIAALDALKIDAISTPAISMLNNVLVFVPRIIIGIAIVFVGRFIANLVRGLLNNVLVSIGTDKVANNVLNISGTKANKDFSLSRIIAGFVKFLIVVFFAVEALNILKLDVLSRIGNTFIGYMPFAVSAIIILGVTILVANYIETAITNKFSDSKVLALVLKVFVIVIGVFITLYQLGIASNMVNSAFIIVLGAFAVAFAISFGIGGRDFASHMLAKLEKKIDNPSVKKVVKAEAKSTSKVGVKKATPKVEVKKTTTKKSGPKKTTTSKK